MPLLAVRGEGMMVLRSVLWSYGVMVLLGLYSGAVPF